MRRNEVGAAVTAAVVSAAIMGAMVLFGALFSNSIWTNGGSNLLGVIVGPSLAASIGVATWTRWHTRCRATRPCIRRGEHPVAATTKKVCEHHHTLHYHELVYELHHVEGMLGWGESHNLGQSASAKTRARPPAGRDKPKPAARAAAGQRTKGADAAPRSQLARAAASGEQNNAPIKRPTRHLPRRPTPAGHD